MQPNAALASLPAPWPAAARRAGRSQARVAAALTAASALLYAAGFPPLAQPWAPWLALAPLLIACATVTPARAALLGLGWAALFGAVVAGFLPGMLASYFAIPAPFAWLAAAALIGAHGLPFAGYAAWVAWLARRGAATPLRLAGGWLAVELLRGSTPGGGWALAAYSQLAWPPVVQIADLAGPYGIGALIAAVNACLAAAVVPALRGRRPLASGALVLAAALATLAYGHWRLGQDHADGAAVPVAVVQGGATPRQPGLRAARLARYATLTGAGARAHGGVVVWPEYATEAYLDEASPTRDAVMQVAAAAGADLVLGGPHFDRAPQAAGAPALVYHNSAYLVRDGRIAARYDKRRLVPVAERAYHPGTGDAVLPLRGLRAGALLCVEAMHPELARAAVAAGAEALLVLSNDAWFGQPAAMRHQFDIAALRAVETRRHLIRAAATGVSGIVDAHGRTRAASAVDAWQVLNAAVPPGRARTVYQRCGDAFAWLAVAAVAVATWRARRVPRPTKSPRRSS